MLKTTPEATKRSRPALGAKGTQRRRAGFPAAAPEEVRLGRGPLDNLRAAIRRNVKDLNALPGCAHLVLKDGRCVFAHAEGFANIERKEKFTLGTLVPLHGASKPLMAAAFLTLVDEGRVKLSDPVDKYIPLSDRVATEGGKTAKATVKPTLRHLLTMTSGVAYDVCPAYKALIKRVRSGAVGKLSSFAAALGPKPLEFQPGRRYHYGFSCELLGHVCEKVSGQRLDRFIASRVLRPLGMRETFFPQAIPGSKRKRLTTMYVSKRVGSQARFNLKRWDPPRGADGIMSPGGGIVGYQDYGMVSSVRDYARFCQMLANGGLAPDGKRRILKASTVRSLWLDGLGAYHGKDGRLPGWNDSDGPGQGHKYWDGVGWSLLNTHLVFQGKQAKPRKTPARRSKYMWMGGGGGAYWTLDASQKLISLAFAPVFLGRASEDDGLGPLANDASPFTAAAVQAGAAEARGRKRQLASSRSKPGGKGAASGRPVKRTRK